MKIFEKLIAVTIGIFFLNALRQKEPWAGVVLIIFQMGLATALIAGFSIGIYHALHPDLRPTYEEVLNMTPWQIDSTRQAEEAAGYILDK